MHYFYNLVSYLAKLFFKSWEIFNFSGNGEVEPESLDLYNDTTPFWGTLDCFI